MRNAFMTTLFLFVIAMVSVGSASAAIYVKFDGIDGESQDKDHKDWINLLSMSNSISRTQGPAAGAARRRSSATFGDIVVSKELDKSSPKLAEAVATGTVFPKVEIHFGMASSEQGIVYLQYELKDVLVTSYGFHGEGDEVPTEEISLNFEEIKMTYTEFDETGRSKGNVEFEWKVEEGTK